VGQPAVPAADAVDFMQVDVDFHGGQISTGVALPQGFLIYPKLARIGPYIRG
jgi:hypothetical protein